MARLIWTTAHGIGLLVVLGSLTAAPRDAGAQWYPQTIGGYRTGAWSFVQTPAGPTTGYQYGPWSVHQTPAGTVTGYRYGPWSVYQTPAGPVTGYRTGAWTTYQTPAGPMSEYRYGPWSVLQTPANAAAPGGPYRPPGLMLPMPPSRR